MLRSKSVAQLLLLSLLCCWLSSGCYRKVCPSYASAFILDDSVRMARFALFGADSMPLPPPKVRKNKNHLIVRVSKRRKLRRMRTIKACKVYPIPRPREETTEERDSLLIATDSLIVADDSLSIVAQIEPIDSLTFEEPIDTLDTQGLVAATDSLSTQYRYGYDPSDNFNVEQIYYNKYFGHLFIEQEASQKKDSTAISEEEEFDAIPDAYIEGSFQEENEEEDEEYEPEEELFEENLEDFLEEEDFEEE